MPTEALSPFTVTLGGVPLTVIATPRGLYTAARSADTDEIAANYDGSFVTQDSTLTLARRDVPIKIDDFRKGSGFVRRRTVADSGGLAWCENGLSWLGTGLMPAAIVDRLGIGSPYNATRFIASEMFIGDLWMLGDHGPILRFSLGNPANGFTIEPAAGIYPAASGYLLGDFRANYKGRAMVQFTDALGNPGLYVGTYDAGSGNSRIYSYTPGIAGDHGSPWRESAILGFRADRMAVVYWTDTTGVGAERLVIRTKNSEIRHCIQGNDPLDPASYVSPTTIGNAAYPIRGFAAFPQALYTVKTNGIHIHNALRSQNVTPSWQDTSAFTFPSTTDEPFGPIMADDEFVYAARGFGLFRYDTRHGEGVTQALPGECGPMYMLQDGTPIRGVITAMCSFEGWILMALYNPENKTTYIGRARDRHAFDPPIDIPNPLVHYWAEAVIPPDAGVGWQVTHMRPAPVSVPAALTPPHTVVNLVMGLTSNAAGTYNAAVSWQELPQGAGPLSLQLSTPAVDWSWRSAAQARFYMTQQDWEDSNANKFIRIFDIASTGAPASTGLATVQVLSRTDTADPRTVTDQTTWHVEGTVFSDARAIVPPTETSAYVLGLQVLLTTLNPLSALPVFQSISPRAKVVRQVFDTRKLWVVLQRDYALSGGQADIREPDTAFDTVSALQNQGRTAFVDEGGVTRTVYVEQGLEYQRGLVEGESGPEWRTILVVDLTLLATA